MRICSIPLRLIRDSATSLIRHALVAENVFRLRVQRARAPVEEFDVQPSGALEHIQRIRGHPLVHAPGAYSAPGYAVRSTAQILRRLVEPLLRRPAAVREALRSQQIERIGTPGMGDEAGLRTLLALFQLKGVYQSDLQYAQLFRAQDSNIVSQGRFPYTQQLVAMDAAIILEPLGNANRHLCRQAMI